MDMIGYVKTYGGERFSERPFCEVDSLILSELSYLIFENVLHFSAPKHTLKELLPLTETLVRDTLLPKSNRRLLAAVAASKRFEGIRVGWLRRRNDKKREVRFAAVTFLTEAGAYVAFRGTDITLLGWKEDLNMSFLERIPSQRLAEQYLRDIAARTEGPLLVGGHSKGGNLALYAAMNAGEATARLIAVYNHDGPGFREPVFEGERYRAIAARTHTTVPHDSLVGFLLCHTEDYKVVKSGSVLIGQHNPFAWVVKDGSSFAQLKERTRVARHLCDAVRLWVERMDLGTRRRFVNALYKLLEGSGAETVPQLLHGAVKCFKQMERTFDTLTDEEQTLIREGGAMLLRHWLRLFRPMQAQ